MDLRPLGILAFALAALAWLALAGLLVARRSAGGRIERMLLVAIGVQVAWAASIAAGMSPDARGPSLIVAGFLEALRSLAWIVLSVGMIPSTRRVIDSGDAPGERTRLAGAAIVAALAAASIAVNFLQVDPRLGQTPGTLMAVAGLVYLEQAYRNTPHARRRALKFPVIALAALFGFDLLMYGDAMLHAQVNPAWWVARGFCNALLVPLMALAAPRNLQWKPDIAVSRQVVFHSTALFVAGGYLLVVAAGGYYVRHFGGEWGAVAQALIVFAALVGLAVVAASDPVRARMRVFLSKHFFSYRFDYRNEWLRLTRTLAGSAETGEGTDLPRRVIHALSQPVESPGGAIWLREDDAYVCASTAGYLGPQETVAVYDPLVSFLAEREWVVEPRECSEHPERYDRLVLPAPLRSHDQAWLIVPLMLRSELLGFVVLMPPLAPLPLDWEVRDLLKTAARQAASHLGVQRAIEELMQARQFESFNRMSAFVVHDLKNLVAQLELTMRNAKRHRDNPEFQLDMLATVENVMRRMQGLLRQLRAGSRSAGPPAPVPLAAVLASVLTGRNGLHPVPELTIDATVARSSVLAHRDRLERVIGHLVQNAAEAAGPSGTIRLQARRDGDDALIEIADNGRGMSEHFIRTRLFRPFVSTKAHGMGIGTFESREYLRELGGSLGVRSREGAGTLFTIRLPLPGVETAQVPGSVNG